MQLRSEIKLASMIKAMKDVVIPSIDAKNDLAIQQAHLIVGLLNLMVHQLPVQFRFDRDELKRLIDCAQGLSGLSTDDPSIGEANKTLGTRCAAAAAVLERCAGDPAELTAAVRDLREATGELMAAAASGRDTAALGVVEKAVLSLSREQLLRDRSLMLPQGWEPDPTLIPEIQSLLQAVTGNP
ncbi:MAG: hypothetical protein M0P39_15350 [Rhodocyclaceae bacterium]|jgi:hypothetical protein|nr:hypothetical protein [Rhodocyclaceae bacterium]